jgi:hypothetical protein
MLIGAGEIHGVAMYSTRREPGFAELLRAILGAALRLQLFDLHLCAPRRLARRYRRFQ